MTDRPDDPEEPLAPFPAAPVPGFPPLEWEVAAPEPAPPVGGSSGEPVEMANADALSAGPVPVPEPASKPLPAHPIVAFGRFAFPPGEPPDDEGVAARDRRWTSRIIVVAAAFLLIFNAVSVQNWSRQQAPGWVTTTVRRLADVWAEQIAILGADQPRQAVRDGYGVARDAEWQGPPG